MVSVKLPAPATPVPLSATVAGDVGSELVRLSVAARGPGAEGVKVTAMVQP